MKFRNLLLSAIASFTVLSASGWGQKGHDVTAAIAERHLTPAAKEAVDSILAGRSMVYYANWPDNACHTPEYTYTKTWHYKNIDEGESYAEARQIPEGDIVRAIESQCQVLSDPGASLQDRWLALVLTVHFLGDIHQPMHMGHATDRGGNSHRISFFGENTNLHTVWDTDLPEAAHRWSYTEWADNIDRNDEREMREALACDSPDSWGEETYGIARKVYEETPQGTDVSYDYIARWTPVVETRFLRGGLRLAHLLNSIFDPAYSKPCCAAGEGGMK